ncbi:hypothetical protein [Pseudoxanthomonas putridarboris]|uniref:Uncharacterized protein n=1 Tax=Pseudoxanthomonas putridarboris TaxID=752605 RepID=A0ABU9IXX0_9GAMM
MAKRSSKKTAGPDLTAQTRGQRALWRDLTILAQDPNVQVDGKPLWSSVTLPCEPLLPGPCGARIKVVDYDASQDRYYAPLAGGYESNGEPVDPFAKASSSARLRDPRFHQQNAYAIAMRILCRFENALGRRVNFGFNGHQLHIAPHAFAEANAYYSRESRSLCFGYFPDDDDRTTFTCLSHDIVAHETAHALLDGLRPRYIDPSSPDQGGFHEGFSDIVALLSILSDERIVETILTREKVMAAGQKLVSRKQLGARELRRSALLGLAECMGETLPNGAATALRRSASLTPTPKWMDDPEFAEPHRRGEILVAAVLNAFIEVWRHRLEGLGEIRRGYLDAARVVEDGATAASHLLTMCIRALDYAPPTDLQYSDYLSALLTADRETVPDDSRFGYRRTIRQCFAAWGIEPTSDPAGDGCWQAFSGPVDHANIRFESLQRNADEAFRFIWQNVGSLKLNTDAYTQVTGVRPIARVAPDGLIVRETVVDFMQILSVRSNELAALGLRKPAQMPTFRQVRLYGGAVLVFNEYGQLKFSIGNGVLNIARQQKRLDHLAESGFFEYRTETAFSRGYFSRLHLNRARGL